MDFKALKDVFLNNQVVSAGSVVTITDGDLADKLLERGTIAPVETEYKPTPTAMEAGQAESLAAGLANGTIIETAESFAQPSTAPAPEAEAEAKSFLDQSSLSSESVAEVSQVTETPPAITEPLTGIPAQPPVIDLQTSSNENV